MRNLAGEAQILGWPPCPFHHAVPTSIQVLSRRTWMYHVVTYRLRCVAFCYGRKLQPGQYVKLVTMTANLAPPMTAIPSYSWCPPRTRREARGVKA